MKLYPFGKAVTCALVRILYDVRYEGMENIPMGQGFILASNHIKAIDPLFIAHKVPQQLHFMAKIELFKNRFIGWILRSVNAFPVDRGKGDTGALDEAGIRIKNGGVLAMFIEGHRSADGRPQRPRSGVALIAGRTGADVLPCAVVCGKNLRFRSRVLVKYGPLIKNDELNVDLESSQTLKLASKKIMGEIVNMFEASIGEVNPNADKTG